MYPQSMLSKNMKMVKRKSTENCHFYIRKISLYIARACFRKVCGLVASSSGVFTC